MGPSDDLIRDLIERFRREARGRIPDDVLLQVEREARDAWAGKRPYIPHKPRDKRQARATRVRDGRVA